MSSWLRASVNTLRDASVATWLATQDGRTPLVARAVLAAALFYYLQPYDLIPDSYLFGYADEILMIPVAAFLAAYLVPQDLQTEFLRSASTIGPSTDDALSWLAARREACVFGLIAVFAVIWIIVPSAIHLALPLDVIESGMWGREWLVGSFKHPALPSWFLEVARMMTGGKLGWSAYLTAELFNAATLTLTFVLVRDLIGSRAAVASVLPLFGIEHFSWRSFEFNHDIAQIPFWIVTVLCAWRAVESPRLLWWSALGIFGGLGLYAKLSHSVILLVLFGWMLWDKKARYRFGSAGPWLAAALFVVVALPLARWLIDGHFGPIAFATERGGSPSAVSFLTTAINLVLVVLPAFVSLGLAGIIGGFGRNYESRSHDETMSSQRAGAFLIAMTVAPIGLSVLLALLAHSGVRQDWFATMICLIPALAVLLARRSITDDVLARQWMFAVATIVVIPAIYCSVVIDNRTRSDSKLMRVNWPQEEIARQLASAWKTSTGHPLKIVAGPDWLAGLVGINNPDNPSILVDGDLTRSPWITPQKIERDGVLAVWLAADEPVAEMQALTKSHDVQHSNFRLPGAWSGNAIQVAYSIVPPRDCIWTGCGVNTGCKSTACVGP